MGPLRHHHSVHNLASAYSIRDPEVVRMQERYAVQPIPRWEELRANASASTSTPPRPLSAAAVTTNAAPELLLPPEPSWDAFYTQTLGADALQRHQEMLYELERSRLRERALRADYMQDSRAESDYSEPAAEAPPAPSSRPRKSQPHKVYMLNCKHCDMFLTDRGMRAVLLLKPHITLYSTDALPTNCSPVYSPKTFLGGCAPSEPPVERTCQCLTQSLGCHGCGTIVGYNIVSPCAECTSGSKSKRGSNGHRTVLHCSEIHVRERRYVPGEPGVRASPIPAEFWRLLELEDMISARSAAATPEMSRTASTGSDATAAESIEDLRKTVTAAGEAAPAGKAHAILVEALALDEQRHMLAIRKEALRAQLKERSKQLGRIIMRGENVYWTDLVSGGERAEPFDPDALLDMPVAGR